MAPRIHMYLFGDDTQLPFEFPASTTRDYQVLEDSAFAGFARSRDIFDVHFHLTGDRCLGIIMVKFWEDDEYLVEAKKGVLSIWAHFVPRKHPAFGALVPAANARQEQVGGGSSRRIPAGTGPSWATTTEDITEVSTELRRHLEEEEDDNARESHHSPSPHPSTHQHGGAQEDVQTVRRSERVGRYTARYR
ncbi:hypothetical protein K491DRAFT_720758 [Lophiostoma macrostomum CBS 122681]|uniref:Uncharacterized protein n=1 Tax=Lophiostoma macrostomum CBS 122681 TaxID=1314788 RepID=A0A6A6SRF7_9PLEO|nr:hypothetical protein K491DRAFT_720758 [Lophiostoma macrostomum CBS 122681]